MRLNIKIAGISALAGIIIVSLFMAHTQRAADTIRIGVIIPLTGQYAPIGESDRNAILMAQRELGAAHMQFFFEDDAYDAKNAVTAYKKLKSIDDINAVIIMSAPSIQAVAPLTNADNIPLLGLGSTNVYEKDSVFQLMPASNLLFSKLGDIYGAKYKRIAIAHSNATLFKENTSKFVSGLPRDVQASDFPLPAGEDYRTDVQKILVQKPEAVTTFMPKEDAIRFLQALRVQDRAGSVKIVCDFGTEIAASEYAAAIGSDRLEGCVSTNIAETATASFKERYVAAYGSNPQITADYAYDAVGLIQKLAQKSSPKDWIAYLSSPTFEYTGTASGKINFNDDGTRLDMPPATHIYHAGRFIDTP